MTQRSIDEESSKLFSTSSCDLSRYVSKVTRAHNDIAARMMLVVEDGFKGTL